MYPARVPDILCGDCSHSFGMLINILGNYPELDGDKFDENIARLGVVFKWRSMREHNVFATASR